MVENFSAGAFERMGFGWERLQELNPGIIYMSLSGFGHAGRDASYVTWGPTAQAVSGVTPMSGLPDQPPAGWGFSYLDHTAGYYGAIAALMALNYRAQTGKGQYIDIAQIETGMVLCGVPMLDYQLNGREYARNGNPRLRQASRRTASTAARTAPRVRIAGSPSRRKPTRSGLPCATCSATRTLPPASASASNRRRLENQARWTKRLRHARASSTRANSCTCFRPAASRPAAPRTPATRWITTRSCGHVAIYPVAPHTELGPHRFDGFPMRFSAARWEVRHGAPCLGEHNLDVLTRILGYSDEEAAEMIAEAAV